MSLPTFTCSRTVIYWVALIAAAMLITPAYADPTPTPSAVAFNCTYTQANPCLAFVPQAVEFFDGATPVNVSAITFVQPNGPNGAVANAFIGNFSGNRVNIGIDQGAVQQVGNNLIAAGGNYLGTLKVTLGTVVVDVPLSLNINATASSSVTVSPTSLSLSTTIGGTTSAVLTVGGSSGVNYSVSTSTTSGGSWLFVTQTTSVTPGSINVTAYAGALGNGSYSGTININAGGTIIPVQVTLFVGTGTAGLTISPSQVNLTAANNTTTTSATVILSSTTGATSYSASISNQTGGTSWLTFGSGQIFISNSPFSGTAGISLFANPAGLNTGQYTATLTVTTSPGNATASVQVFLNVGTGGNTGLLTINPSSLAFSAPVLNSSPASQTLTVTAPAFNTTYNLSATSSGWLTVNGTTFTSGTLNLSASFTVSANTFNLPAGSYNGSISITTSGGTTTSATIPVSLVVGFGSGTVTGAVIAPASITFSGQSNGINKPGPQYIAVGGTGGLYTAVAATSTGGSWLSIDSGSGNSPSWVTASVNPSGLAAGTYSGTVSITQGGVTSTVPVTLTLTSGAAAVVNPSGVFTNAYSGGNPPSQTLFLQMSDNTVGQTYTATASASWITVSPATGTLSGSTALGILINAATLPSGLSTGTVTLTVSGAANSPLTIPITLNNFGGTGGGTGGYLTFSQTALGFSDTNPAAQTVLISSSLGSVGYTASATTNTGASWLFVSPLSGSTPSNATISVSTSGLASGTYQGNVNFTANGVTQSVSVTLTIGSGTSVGAIVASPVQLNFEAQGSTAPAAQTLNLSASGGVVSWSGSVTTASGGTWLSLSTSAGALPGSVQVNVNPAGLAAGNYTGTITFTPNAGNQTRVGVTLKVNASPTVTASPTSLTYSYRSGDAVPAAQQINVTAQDSTTPLSWSASVTSGAGWLSISPTTGTTPGTINVNLTPGNLDPGSYTGVIAVTGTSGAAGSTNVSVTLTVTAPLPSVTRVVNGASYTSGALAPGEIIVISGTAIGPNELTRGSLDSSTGRWATTVGGVQVLVNGFTAPVLYATSNQVGAVVPYSVAGRLDAFVQVRFRGLTSNTITIPVTTTVPGIFTQNSSGSGPGAILNPDGGLNGPGNGAAKGSIVAIYATGEGLSQNASGARPETGQIVNVASIADLPRPLLPVAVLIDGQPATVVYAGQAPGQIAGLFQINVIVPPASGSGNVSLAVTVGSNSSQSGVTVSVR